MKFTSLLFTFALLGIVGCHNQPTQQTKTETKTETVKMIEVETPAKKVESETSISVGPNGGSVKTKKIDVKVETNN